MTTVNRLERLYSRQELKEMGLGSISYIDKAVAKGLLTKIKLGRNTRFKESDVLSFMNKVGKKNENEQIKYS